MVTAMGHSASPYQNEQVQPSAQASDYYVAHLFLLPDEPGPAELTPFYFASVDLCELAPYMTLLLSTPSSLHGYVRNFHSYNNLAARLHRFSHYLITCYSRNFNQSYAEGYGSYLVKVVYVPPRIPLKLLELLTQYDVPPILIAGTADCAARAHDLGLPCFAIDDVTPTQLNEEIGLRFSTPATPLTPEQRTRLGQGNLNEHIPPNVLVTTFPGEYVFHDSHLQTFPTSGLRLLLPNEALSNQLRRRCMPPAPANRPDPKNNLERAIASMRVIFAQRLSDYLLEDPDFGLADDTMAPPLHDRLEYYASKKSADGYDALVGEAEKHLAEYPGACNYILCCPAINKRSSERIFTRAVPDRVLKRIYRAKAPDFLTYVTKDDFRSEAEFQQFIGLMMYQGLENAYLSTVLALYAVSYRQAVLRTPQLSSGLFGKLRQLRTTYDDCSWHAFSRDLHRFGNFLFQEFPPEVRNFLTSTRSDRLKLISDLPLEWLAVNGVPLMFQQTLSRIPLTPGNALYAHFNACREDLFIGSPEADRVLVLNCLAPDDRLYPYPGEFAKNLTKMGVSYSYVEPANIKDYTAALRTHKPYILVHWGHGDYDHHEDRGCLLIRREKTEIWDLRDGVVPPIVLLAACQSAAIAETHNTPANGWLALGARSVLASYFPVQADLTSVLFSRIFANLLEAVHGQQLLSTWEVVVSKTLFLNRYLDFFYGFVDWCRRRGLPLPPGQVLLEYTYLWNHQQRASLAEGYRRCPELLTQAMERFGSDLANSFRVYLSREAVVPHTMFFAHLGSPETILIRKDRQSTFEKDSPALAYWQMRSKEASTSASAWNDPTLT